MILINIKMFKIKLTKILALFAATTIGDVASYMPPLPTQDNLTFGYDAFEKVGAN